ncbi:ribonuclease D [Reinekea marinisedimentorum]|uniref:Ribonuclease D n=1 Tax=Reinekea marinisedimentorum TaxID=230495 RepID=A0A4R3I9L9_9GAMM|nr:ribonuclease D [Reinekea marinisedimentorum]TCS42053.1 ribonuclease D [Reinekea marinisedimentorum]
MSRSDPFIWVQGDQQLALVCQQWQQSSVIAIDTEFVRTETFHANLGLIQVCIEDTVWLVDPLDIQDWRPLQQVLTNPDITKVFHSLSEDSEVIKHSVGVLLCNVFDTQIAAALLGYPLQVSYAKLVEGLFGEQIDKDATRSDWLARPLTNKQCEYAAADVFWLYRIYGELAEQLKNIERYDWVAEDSERQILNNLPAEPDQYYLKLRGGWKLKGVSLFALKELAAWRERKARQENCNRGRILQDKELIQIVERMPSTKGDLQHRLKLNPRKIRLYGDAIMQILKTAETINRQQWPERIDGPLPADQSELLKKVRERISQLADQHNIPAEVLAKRKQLESWLRSGCRDGQYRAPDVFNGWRGQILLAPVNELLSAQWGT